MIAEMDAAPGLGAAAEYISQLSICLEYCCPSTGVHATHAIIYLSTIQGSHKSLYTWLGASMGTE
jgi:hypothetical protein